jgi:hypothetical protein
MANISHFTQTVSGVSTTYDIHDANAVQKSEVGDIVTHNASEFVLVSDLATVATSGSYTDLSDKPTIPTVNNGTLTIQKNGDTVGTFSANQATDETINIEVPDVNNGTLTIQQNGTTLGTFTANASVDKAINITTTDDTKIPLAGSNQISGDLIPSTDNTIDIGSSSKKIKSVFANYLNSVNLSTLFDISNAGYMTDLNDSTLRVKGKIVVCSYNTNTLNIPTPGASGTCFTLANQDSSNYGVQVTFSNKGIYARFIDNDRYGEWGTIIK